MLNANAEILRKYPSWVITIEGHSDERGTAEYNLALGERRAAAARTYLVSLGIPADRLKTVSYGKEFPVRSGPRRGGLGEEPARAFRRDVASRPAVHGRSRRFGELVRVEVSEDAMRSTGRLAGAVMALTLAVPALASAANKEHQQLMAEIRMLQEQQQQLQQMLGGLADTLKAMTTRLDSDADVDRKAFADQKLLVSGVADTVRVLREKADDTNVRLSTMTQEMQALRQTVASMPAPRAGADRREPRRCGGRRSGRAPPAPCGSRRAAPSRPNISPTRMYDQSYADYSAGQYDLAVEGFQAFIRTFPTSPQAPTKRSSTSATRSTTPARTPRRWRRCRR